MAEKKNKKRKIPLIPLIAVVAAVGVAIGGWIIFHGNTPETEQNETLSSNEALPETEFSQDYSDYLDYSAENDEQATTESVSSEQQQEHIAKEQCDKYLDAYENSTPEELASDDQSVKAKYSEWQKWLKKAKEVEGTQLTPEQCQSYWSKDQPCPNQYAEKAQQAESEYKQLLSQKNRVLQRFRG